LIARKAGQIIRTLDASLLSTFMDGVFIVALQGKTRKNELERAMRLLEGAEAKILGAVLNQK
jgi:Mrp family chromosome partitioning ATPase